MDADEELYIPLSALNAYSYCPHRMYREHVLHEWEDNVFTVDGEIQHERAHTEGNFGDGDISQMTRVFVKSDRHRLVGIVDVVESRDGRLYPVEYKHGRKGKWFNDELQVCAQALCLEEQCGCSIDRGYIWYAGSRRRVEVLFTEALRRQVVEIAAAARRVYEGEMTPPAEPSRRCKGCSIRPLCLPVETRQLNQMDCGCGDGDNPDDDLPGGQ